MTFRWLTLFLDSGGCHLDLHLDPATGTVDQAADRAVALGAVVRHASEGLVIMGSPGGFTFCSVFPHWTTMADPTGRLYCLTVREPETGRPPEPVA